MFGKKDEEKKSNEEKDKKQIQDMIDNLNEPGGSTLNTLHTGQLQSSPSQFAKFDRKKRFSQLQKNKSKKVVMQHQKEQLKLQKSGLFGFFEQFTKKDLTSLFFMLIQFVVDLYHTASTWAVQYYKSENSKTNSISNEQISPKRNVKDIGNKKRQLKRGDSSTSNIATKKREATYNFTLTTAENNADWYNNYDYPFDDGWKCQIF